MPARFNHLGLDFQYPDNWQLDDADARLGRRSITVYSPDGGAFWSVTIEPVSIEPAEVNEVTAQTMRQEYTDFEAEPVTETILGMELVGYDFNFYCLDLLSSAQVRSLRRGNATYSILCQAEDREFERLKLVFQAMTTSLLGGLAKAKKPKA